MTTGRRTRVGVVGTAYWAQSCHGTALATHPDVEFVGFWGRNADKALDAAQHVGGRGFNDYDQFLDAVDAVAIAVSPTAQPEYAIRAAQAGKHLLLDKPLALDIATADRVVAAATTSNVASLVFFTYRFDPQTAAWLDNMQHLAADHGPWEGVISGWTGSIDVPGNPYEHSVWRRERGGLWDWGPHAVSVLDALLPEFERVSATRGVRDTVNVAFEHRGGPSSSASMSVTAAEKGVGGFLLVWGPGGRHHMPPLTAPYVRIYKQAINELLQSAATGQPHPLDVNYGRRVVAIIAAADAHLDQPVSDRTAPITTAPTAT